MVSPTRNERCDKHSRVIGRRTGIGPCSARTSCRKNSRSFSCSPSTVNLFPVEKRSCTAAFAAISPTLSPFGRTTQVVRFWSPLTSGRRRFHAPHINRNPQIGIRRSFVGCSRLHATLVFALCSPRTARVEHHLHRSLLRKPAYQVVGARTHRGYRHQHHRIQAHRQAAVRRL